MKTKVGVLRGGASPEYDISLTTGKHILDMLKRPPLDKNYEPVDIFVDRDNVWHIQGKPVTPEEAVARVDVMFNAMHSNYKGDGRVQGILDAFAVPYTGSKLWATSIAGNKMLTKKTLSDNGIKSPYSRELNIKIEDNLEPIAVDLFKSFPMPVIVKPRDFGSSLGVSVARNFDELIAALEHARGFGQEIIVEEYLTGKEIIAGFIDDFRDQPVYHTIPVEIKHNNHKTGFGSSKVGGAANGGDGHFDWVSKNSGSYEISAPANISELEKQQIQNAVALLRSNLGMRHYGTFDFIVHPKRGVYMLDANTHPSIHEHSPILRSLSAVGVKASEFVEHLIKLAMGRGVGSGKGDTERGSA